MPCIPDLSPLVHTGPCPLLQGFNEVQCVGFKSYMFLGTWGIYTYLWLIDSSNWWPMFGSLVQPLWGSSPNSESGFTVFINSASSSPICKETPFSWKVKGGLSPVYFPTYCRKALPALRSSDSSSIIFAVMVKHFQIPLISREKGCVIPILCMASP